MKFTGLNLSSLVAAAAISACVAPALAQYPERPIHLLVPFAPGGGTDIVARQLSPKLNDKLGRQIIIENRDGAGGVIASNLTARAAPDGYTLLLTTTNHSANPSMIKELPYDSVNDFSMISLMADLPELLLVSNSVPVSTFPEFVALAKKQANMTYGSPGVGTFPHLAMAMLTSRADLKMTHVPYKGEG